MDGYKNKGGIIATEAPLQDTINDFWIMALECNVTTIVTLFTTEEGTKSYPVFWPEKSLKCGAVLVEVLSTSKIGNLELYSISMSNEKV